MPISRVNLSLATNFYKLAILLVIILLRKSLKFNKMEWIISLLCGAGGGNLAGMLLKKLSLGTLGNSIVGILGGAAGQGILANLGALTGNGVGDAILGGTVGGGGLMAIVALVKKLIAK